MTDLIDRAALRAKVLDKETFLDSDGAPLGLDHGALDKDEQREQRVALRIVAILDKFDALTNSLTEGLPREIELRQKQYAHYRDMLLSFPKPQEVMA